MGGAQYQIGADEGKDVGQELVHSESSERDISMHLATVGVVGIVSILVGRYAFRPQ